MLGMAWDVGDDRPPPSTRPAADPAGSGPDREHPTGPQPVPLQENHAQPRAACRDRSVGQCGRVTRNVLPPAGTDQVNTGGKGEVMPEMMARVEVEDFGTWLGNHRSQAEQRRGYGMTDGPIYRDVQDPNAAFVHIHVEDLARARQWFRTDEFMQATRRAGVIRREFYLAEVEGRPGS